MKITKLEYIWYPVGKMWKIRYALDGVICKTLQVIPKDTDIPAYVCRVLRAELDCQPREYISNAKTPEESSTKQD